MTPEPTNSPTAPPDADAPILIAVDVPPVDDTPPSEPDDPAGPREVPE